MQYFEYPDRKEWKSIIKRPLKDHENLFETVNAILKDVKDNGDEAIKQYELTFDKVCLDSIRVSTEEIEEAERLVDDSLKEAITHAYKNVYAFHSEQKFIGKRVETDKGVVCWQKAVPIQKVGLYVPGGTAPLFSTVIMLATPAKIAGCSDIILCSPPDKNGKIHPAILFAAKVAGVSQIFKIGGVQAIAAMAFGTQTVPKVYKIFGPGNQYVMAAKQAVSLNDVAIDMPAGPSEVAVVTDHTSNPEFVAADLLSQAEHGIDSQVILVSTDNNVVGMVMKEIERQLEVLPRRDIAAKSLENSKCVLLNDINEAMDLINEYAPEHLILPVENYHSVIDMVINAGSVFLGNYSCESAGDYASGTNHTLPTNGYAKAYSGVSLDSFIKKITFQELSTDGILSIAETVETMAHNELLHAHENAMTVRRHSLE